MLKNINHYEDLTGLSSDIRFKLFESFKDEVKSKNAWNRWHRSRPNLRKVGDYTPWEIANRMIEKNIGKPFGQVFSDFCHIVRSYQQNVFLEEFKGRNNYFKGGFYFQYYIDENGLIQTNDKPIEKKPFVFYSSDYKTKKVHIITGKEKPEPSWWNKKTLNDDHMYKEVVISGFSYTAETKSDRKFQRFNAEKIKASKRPRKKKYKSSITEEKFRQILKQGEIRWYNQEMSILEQKRKEEEINLVKIIKHGFDPLTSFRHR